MTKKSGKKTAARKSAVRAPASKKPGKPYAAMQKPAPETPAAKGKAAKTAAMVEGNQPAAPLVNMPDDESIEAIAEICHMRNRGYCRELGDDSQPVWRDAPGWMKASAINGVKFAIINGLPPMPGATPPSLRRMRQITQAQRSLFVFIHRPGAAAPPHLYRLAC